ncbi:MAG: hypothetical protein RIR18_1443 [Pseudomonadota bacterium]|jgi:Ca2+-binding RTX toxin-like protein
MPTFTAYLAAVMGKLPKTSKANPVEAGTDSLTWMKNSTKAYELTGLNTGVSNNLSVQSNHYANSSQLNAGISNLLSGNDVIIGSDFADTLFGYAGNDVIYGGNGKDILYGGTGADTFVFDTAPSENNVDTIKDFSQLQGDKIHLDNLAFSGLTVGSLSADAFVSTTSSKPVLDTQVACVVFNSKSGVLYFDADGSGTAHGLVKIAVIVGQPNLNNSDIEVVTSLDLDLI